MADNPTSTDSTAPCTSGACTANPCLECGQPTHSPGCDGSTQPHPGSSFSAEPVRYSNGEIFLVSEDLSFKSFGLDWGHTRSYGNRVTDPEVGRNGNSWFVKEWPYLVPIDPDSGDPNQPQTISLVWLINDTLWFDFDASTGKYVARFFVRPKLRHDADNQQWTLTDSEGRVTKFFDFDPAHPEELRGQFKSITDAAGRETAAVYDESNRISSFVQEAAGAHTGYYYNYLATGANAGRLAQVTYKVNGLPLRRAQYVYCGPSESHGSLGDLKRVTIGKFDGTQWTILSRTYYRYYTKDGHGGVKHGLRFVLSPLGYQQMVAHGITPEISTNAQLAGYAKHEFRYNADRSVSDETVNAGTANYRMQRSAKASARLVSRNSEGVLVSTVPQVDPPEEGFNAWITKTVEDLPDGNRRVVYTNFAGQPILSVFIIMKGGQETTQTWCDYTRYDDAGRIVLQGEPSAVASFDESNPGLVTLKETSGLLRLREYYTTGDDPGAAPGRVRRESVQKGSAGTPVKLKEWQYISVTIGDDTVSYPAQETLYQSAASGGAAPAVTSYSYTWERFQVEQKTTTWPVVPAEQNGSGVADQAVEFHDLYGRLIWQQNERDYITGFKYDPATDALIQRTEDVAGDAPWPVLPGDHLNLVTDYLVDDEGRTTQELGPVHEIDLGGTAAQVRRASWTIYQDAAYQQWSGAGFQKVSDGSFTLINPVGIQVFDEATRLLEAIQAVRADTSGPLRATDSFPQSTWVRWTSNYYGSYADVAAQSVYFLIPESGAGTRDVNYNESEFAYDIFHRRVRERTPGGTITRSVYHPRGWVLSKWVGTDDTGADDTNPSGGGAPGNNMVIVESYQYDANKAGGDGNLTKFIQHVDATEERQTIYHYDFRDRRTSTDGEIDFWEGYTLDNLDRVTRTDQRNTTSNGTLVRRNATQFDNRGRIFRTLRYGVNPETGVVSAPLADNFWFDSAGNLIKRQAMGSRALTKMDYDAINRATASYLACDPTETAYSDASNVADDTVVEQTETQYDGASNAIFVTQRARFHNAPGAGPLQGPTGAQPRARVTYTANWPDPLGRVISSADYGTNDGSVPTRPAVAPAASDDILVTVATYNNQGEAWQRTDPAGKVQQTTFDDAGRKTRELQNVVSGGPGFDQNQTTLFTYTPDGALATLTSKNSVTGDQVTTWTYGTTLADSAIASSLLLRSKVYPDAASDKVEFKYNRQSQQTQMTDQCGTVHVYDYDELGRLLHDRVTELGNGSVDGAVRRISFAYDVRGLTTTITSVDNPSPTTGNVVNQVVNRYNDYEQLITQPQAHGGAAGSDTPEIGYAYADGSANTTRLEKITYPSGRKLHYSYGNGGSNDEQLSRVAALLDDNATSHLADYQYVGADAFSLVEYPQPGIKLTYQNDEGDAYTGWDRFGRIVDQRWLKSGTAVERLQYGYDRAGNRLYRKNVVAASGHDELYSYDGLNQLRELQRGTLNNSRTALTGPPVWEEDFTYDPAGNWNNYLTKAGGSTTLDQDRTHNSVNAIITLDGSANLLGYDATGNMTRTPQPQSWSNAYDLTWDAWNRLVKVKDGSATVASYAYDGLTRRITSTDSVSNVRHYYYTKDWQILEERTGTSITAERQFVWGQQRPDDLVLRDRTASSTTERLYSLSDPLNVTSITDPAGTIQERYGYSAFGIPTVLSPAFAPRSTSSYGWETRFGGYRFDHNTQLYQVRYRHLHPQLGRWLSRDPFAEKDDDNLYCYIKNSPIGSIDPLGLFSFGHNRWRTGRPYWNFYTCHTPAIPGWTYFCYVRGVAFGSPQPEDLVSCLSVAADMMSRGCAMCRPDVFSKGCQLADECYQDYLGGYEFSI